MIGLQLSGKEFDEITAPVQEKGPKVKIPWDKIDEWIETVDLRGDDQPTTVLDPGDRRN